MNYTYISNIIYNVYHVHNIFFELHTFFIFVKIN